MAALTGLLAGNHLRTKDDIAAIGPLAVLYARSTLEAIKVKK